MHQSLTDKAEERKISVTFYENKRSPAPHAVRTLRPSALFDFLSNHPISDEKDGPCYGQYKLKEGTSRANANVVSRSGIDLDIDNGATLDELRPALAPYSWAAYSTHSHNPDVGDVKFRIALPFSREAAPDEWPQIWEGCNALLGGVVDQNTKDISRMVFTPRCPEATKHHAFFEMHEGALVKPDTLISLAPNVVQVAAPRTQSDFAAGMDRPPPQETQEEIARVRSMLKAVPASCGYGPWRNVVWAVASLGWKCGKELAAVWSADAPDKFNEATFMVVWNSYNPSGGVGFGTLVHHAKQHGWVDSAPPAEERFTGSGGDVTNGRVFAGMFRNRLLFIHETGEVLVFDETQGWIGAPPGEADRAAKAVLEWLRVKAVEAYKNAPDDPKTKRLMAHVERTSKAPNLRAMIEMAKSEPGMTCRLSDFDNDPMQLGVANGVLDLHTGKLFPVSPDLLVSKRCNVVYDPAAECPVFMNYLGVVQPKEILHTFLQRMSGYCLTGLTVEQKLAFLHGGGLNGKSVFVELMAWLLGDYARKIATEMLMHHQRSPQGPSPDIVALKGCRFAYANETEEGRRLAESRVKDLTGGDTLTGRVPYGKADITFAPSHKLFIVGNHRPDITDNSFGMWRRVLLVPFDVTIPLDQRDTHLLKKLRAEGSGILNWMLDGLRQWQRGGLMVPKEIEAATAAYRDDMDIVGEWLAEHCNPGTGQTVAKAEAYKAYHTWARSNGHSPMAQKKLTRRLGERGFPQLPDKRTIGGLSLTGAGKVAALNARP